MDQTGHDIAQTAHATAQAVGEAHELPNFLTVLAKLFPENPVFDFLHRWENIVFSLLVIGFIGWRAIAAARTGRFIPKGAQNAWEAVTEGLTSFVTGILGPRGVVHVPFLGTLFIYILFDNWLGLVPFLKSPTSGWSTTIALAIVTIVYVHATGIREQGPLNYAKHMMGSPQGIVGIALAPLMLVINITVDYLAVPLSLSLRLFANISSEDRLLYKFAELNVMYKMLPFFFQLFANVLVIIFSLVQAFVFLLLSTVYISLIMPREDHDHDGKAHEKKATAIHH